jgi:simple sugar transport system permease protein
MRRLLREITIPALAIFTALLISVPVIGAAAGWDWSKAAAAYGGLIDGALLKPNALTNTLVAMTPLILTGLAVLLGIKAGLFNIGASGQFLVGATAGVFVGYAVQLPPILHPIMAMTVGALAGAAWGAIPGYLKAKRGAHEVITTIMMNYLAFFLSDWLIKGPMKDPCRRMCARPTFCHRGTGSPVPLRPTIACIGAFIIAVAMTIAVWWLFRKQPSVLP